MLGRQLAVYSRGALNGSFKEELQRRPDRGRKKEEEEKDGRKLRNLTTPHRVVGIKMSAPKLRLAQQKSALKLQMSGMFWGSV